MERLHAVSGCQQSLESSLKIYPSAGQFLHGNNCSCNDNLRLLLDSSLNSQWRMMSQQLCV